MDRDFQRLFNNYMEKAFPSKSLIVAEYYDNTHQRSFKLGVEGERGITAINEYSKQYK